MKHSYFNIRLPLLLSLTLTTAVLGCKKQAVQQGNQPPPEVSVYTVTAEDVTFTSELPGRINPVRDAELRARATGILEKRLFEEGATVEEGQVLFEIDPAPLQAALDSARASLAGAEANLKDAQSDADRYEKLIETNAISKQVYDQATATLSRSEADLLAAKAAVQTAELNLGYTKVVAPISGKIGKALVTEGALVSASEATQLAVIRQTDPVYFDFTQSSTEVLRLKRALEAGSMKSSDSQSADVTLKLEDGTAYPHSGKLLFTDISVDPTTGMVTLRAEFPNPDGLLLPGMFARVEIVEGVKENALSVPQRTIIRGAGGSASVMVVNPENKVEPRNLVVDQTVGIKTIVSSGLSAGDLVIVEGFQKVAPGAVVTTVPFGEPGDSKESATSN